MSIKTRIEKLEKLLASKNAPPETVVRITPQGRRRYTLDDLLAQCDARARPPKPDRDWVVGAPVGRELL